MMVYCNQWSSDLINYISRVEICKMENAQWQRKRDFTNVPIEQRTKYILRSIFQFNLPQIQPSNRQIRISYSIGKHAPMVTTELWMCHWEQKRKKEELRSMREMEENASITRRNEKIEWGKRKKKRVEDDRNWFWVILS